MRCLINYFRQCFCQHEFEFDEVFAKGEFGGQGIRISMLCKKCGYHRSKWKHII